MATDPGDCPPFKSELIPRSVEEELAAYLDRQFREIERALACDDGQCCCEEPAVNPCTYIQETDPVDDGYEVKNGDFWVVCPIPPLVAP